ncbi:hypothetical protein LTR56_008141 [Elasticomyces elasticus]|nr:hypothetical protein LTR56_008141 [Elasticomyces elasticus]KAK3662893.1 hypothetical protein LTR22_006296 [Elasticomyces elasticus]KAK4930088.1 hypothetical protein LTR49_003416 [Elasticomyces elasticus]KAK5763530.1 hypothetical protein LTS12_006301 [Elasticomyces elasticus]
MDEDVTGAPASGRQDELLVALSPDVYVKQVREPPRGFWDECLTAQAKPTTLTEHVKVLQEKLTAVERADSDDVKAERDPR